MSRLGKGASRREEPTELATTLEAYSRGLELHVWAMADSLRHGDNPSSIPGRGIEVSGVREYQHGDEARGIDWRVTARRGRLFVKEFSQERELPLLVILNLTPSLWSGRGESKAIRAVETASLLAALGLRSGDRVGMILAGGGGGLTIPPGNGRNHLPRILQALMAPPSWRDQALLADTLAHARFLLRERARVFLMGDFQIPLADLEKLRTGLSYLRDRHHLVPVRITDRKEGEIPAGGSIQLRDPADGRTRLFRRRRGSRFGGGGGNRMPGAGSHRPMEGGGKKEELRTLLAAQEEAVSTFFRNLGLEDWSVDVNDSLIDTLRTRLYPPGSRVARRAGPGEERKATGA